MKNNWRIKGTFGIGTTIHTWESKPMLENCLDSSADTTNLRRRDDDDDDLSSSFPCADDPNPETVIAGINPWKSLKLNGKGGRWVGPKPLAITHRLFMLLPTNCHDELQKQHAMPTPPHPSFCLPPPAHRCSAFLPSCNNVKIIDTVYEFFIAWSVKLNFGWREKLVGG